MKNILFCALFISVGPGNPWFPAAVRSERFNTSDISFIQEALEHSMSETQLSLLAQNKSASDDVLALAQFMISRHVKNSENLMGLVLKKNIALLPWSEEKSTRRYNRISGREGDDFDMAYVRSMVNDHKKLVKIYRRQVERAGDPEIQALAAEGMYRFILCLDMAESTLEKLNKK